jgi:hypothetical protein
LGFNGGFNYKKEEPDEALARLAPQGLNIYYDMAGGEQLDAALGHMCDFGRIGKISLLLPQKRRFSLIQFSRMRPKSRNQAFHRVKAMGSITPVRSSIGG